MEIIISICGIVISLAALGISIYFSVLGAKANKRNENIALLSKELSETQKILAMLGVLTPIIGEEDGDAWRLMMRYLISKNKLPSFNDEDYETLARLLSRLEMKIEIKNGRLKES